MKMMEGVKQCDAFEAQDDKLAENPIIAQNRLQPGNHGPAFHESPDEGYHEDDGGSETM